MAKNYIRIASVFSEGELLLIEDALRKYEMTEASNLSEKGQDITAELRKAITDARRWKHQFEKVERG